MTNHWTDLKNADVILVMGSNPAENHPISMKWMMRAREKGAKLIEGPYVAETFRVSVEDDYVVIEA